MTAPSGELEAQVQNMPRGQIMREFVGPALTRLLRPVYDPVISSQEAERIRPIQTFQTGHWFAEDLMEILKTRYKKLEQANPLQANSDRELVNSNPDHQLINSLAVNGETGNRTLFTFPLPDALVEEGIASGVAVPLTIASQIDRVEDAIADLPVESVAGFGLDPLKLMNIMRRKSFDRILMRLTKGPNGFLGHHSTHPLLYGRGFFAFGDSNHKPLTISEAFVFKDGQVVDLSAAYHVAAEERRQYLTRSRTIGVSADISEERKKATAYYANSSGCPVRHGFKDELGDPQEPLILSAKEFLIAALKVSANKKAEKNAAARLRSAS